MCRCLREKCSEWGTTKARGLTFVTCHRFSTLLDKQGGCYFLKNLFSSLYDLFENHSSSPKVSEE